MSYDELTIIIEHLKEDLTNFIGSLDTDTGIIKTRHKFKAVCKPGEIIESYIDDLQEIMDYLICYQLNIKRTT